MIHEIRTICADDVREMCIDFDFYTHGDNEDYEQMLHMCRGKEATTKLLEEIALDIMRHSELEKLDAVGADSVTGMMYLLCRITTSYFVTVNKF